MNNRNVRHASQSLKRIGNPDSGLIRGNSEAFECIRRSAVIMDIAVEALITIVDGDQDYFKAEEALNRIRILAMRE